MSGAEPQPPEAAPQAKFFLSLHIENTTGNLSTIQKSFRLANGKGRLTLGLTQQQTGKAAGLVIDVMLCLYVFLLGVETRELGGVRLPQASCN